MAILAPRTCGTARCFGSGGNVPLVMITNGKRVYFGGRAKGWAARFVVSSRRRRRTHLQSVFPRSQQSGMSRRTRDSRRTTCSPPRPARSGGGAASTTNTCGRRQCTRVLAAANTVAHFARDGASARRTTLRSWRPSWPRSGIRLETAHSRHATSLARARQEYGGAARRTRITNGRRLSHPGAAVHTARGGGLSRRHCSLSRPRCSQRNGTR
jgi:hypothetical protein